MPNTSGASHSGTGPPDWLDPELATLTTDRFSDPAWIYERKFDGEQTSFSRLQRRLGVRAPGQDLLAEVPVQVYLFDVLWPKAGTCAPTRCTSASGCCAACCRSAARCSSPSTGTPTARRTTGRPAAGAGKA